jgi:ribosomal protein L11 methyltransferase
VRVAAERAEQVLAELLELAPAGFEQVDGDGWVEFAVYGAPGELPDLSPGPARIGSIEVEVSASTVGDDWADRWREFHRPADIGHIRVRAPWHEPRAEAANARGGDAPGIDIVIDPGQAFGTGAHPTTRLCLELLQEITGDPVQAGAAGNPPGRWKTCGTHAAGPLVDLGCGSGVLAIAAAELGFAPIVAVDHEQAAVEATLSNARANGVTLERVERCDLRTEPAPVAPVTLANLVRPLLLRVAELWRAEAEPPAEAELLPEQSRTLIVSGLLEGEEDEVAAAFASFDERRRLRLQGWSALLLTRP